eukprot:225514-Amphidinium_carterae.1
MTFVVAVLIGVKHVHLRPVFPVLNLPYTQEANALLQRPGPLRMEDMGPEAFGLPPGYSIKLPTVPLIRDPPPMLPTTETNIPSTLQLNST